MGEAASEVVAEHGKEGRIPAEAREMLSSLAASWEDVADADALKVIQLKGAMTNEVFQIKWPTTGGEVSRKVLVRIYGEGVEVFFDREDEIMTFEFMSRQGQGPRLLGRFSNGRIEEFIHARTLSASDLRDPDTSALIAAKLKEFHGLEMPGAKNVRLWERIGSWLKTAKSLCSVEEAESFRLDDIGDEISMLEKEFSGDQCVGFCHNDLQYGNIMIDEETKAITIIDYEYASYNPVAFDIANHFCEMAADYHSDAPHILDFSKYPGLEERKRFVLQYLTSSGGPPGDTEVDQLLEEVEKYTLGSHLFWGLWGIISGHVSKIDFDYMGYGRQRLEQYWLRKPALLGSAATEGTPDSETDGKEEVANEKMTKEEATDEAETTMEEASSSSSAAAAARKPNFFGRMKKFLTFTRLVRRSPHHMADKQPSAHAPAPPQKEEAKLKLRNEDDGVNQ